MNPAPSIGRMVIYHHSGSADGKFPPMVSPAVVQKVNEDGTCDLFVMSTTGGIFFPKAVEFKDLAVDNSPTKTGWSWPERV